MSAQRDRMIAEAVKTGMTFGQAAELTDISKHAFDQAFASARAVIDTAQPELRIAILTSVLASFSTLMRERFPEHWDAFVKTSIEVGESQVIILPDGGGR